MIYLLLIFRAFSVVIINVTTKKNHLQEICSQKNSNEMGELISK